jgi:hypothetical protein
MATVTPASGADRDDAAAFAGRLSRWDPVGPVRLRADGELIRLWGTTPFDTLVTRAVRGSVEPRDATVHAGNLMSALAVAATPTVDPGPVVDAAWRTQLPPAAGWIAVDRIPVTVIDELVDRGAGEARDRPGPAGGTSTALLDSEVLTVSGQGMRVVLPLRVLFALSGMSFAGTGPDEVVKVSATDAWLRVDGRFGAVVRRRQSLLPLFV